MFTLWYSILTYKEYREVIWDKLGSKKAAQPKETAIVCPLPPKKNEPAPVIEPTKPTTPVSPKISTSLPSPPIKPATPPVSQSPVPSTPVSPKVPPSFPSPQIKPVTPPVLQKLDPPPKPPRSPSPHPIRAEAFDNVDDDDDDEESEESSEPEEEDSVLATPPKKPIAKSVNDFINKEKNDLL
ncbi:uncharacterized protein LOC143197670 [Rhynchophorus ferrugineus]|uniref:uncharacterized protein LOC143197670 n=1 Tax=Rhynchophorus ferrugineus TaxID=354439 RepID=UPI003FCC6ED2